MLKKETARCFQTCLALFILIFLAAAESPSKDIARLLDLATFGRVNLSATRVSSSESDGNETGGLNEFFFTDNGTTPRGSGGDLGLMAAQCFQDDFYIAHTCHIAYLCNDTCNAACAGYEVKVLQQCPVNGTVGDLCECWCANTSGCSTCGSNVVADCDSVLDSGTCQDSYQAGGQSCMWWTPAYGDPFCFATVVCTPPVCFLQGTKIITVGVSDTGS